MTFAPDADAVWAGDAYIGLNRQFRSCFSKAKTVIGAPHSQASESGNSPEEGLNPIFEFAEK
jgi:hypothetical protein